MGTLSFGEFVVDLRSGCLTKQGVEVKLRQQLLVALSALLERPGDVTSREELRRRLWPKDMVVDFENDLNAVIARLRETLGDSADHPRYIETLPKRGYRFLARPSECPASALLSKGRVRLVVLPFSNTAGDPAEDYFCDAVTDEIITALCQVAPGRLAVIARSTAMHYKGGAKDVADIARELGVDYVVEGGVRRDGDRVALNVQLVQTSDRTHIFAQGYAGERDDIFPLVRSATADIAGRIGLAPSPGSRPDRPAAGGPGFRRPTEDPTAYNEYIQARYFICMGSPSGFESAARHLQKALAVDPEFALAYDALAEIFWLQGYYGYIPPRRAFSAGLVHALRAIEIDGSRAETHALLGEFHKTLDYNWPEVRREMALALRLDPASPLVRLRYAISDLMPHARLDEAIAQIETALELDPMSLMHQAWLGIMLVLAHRWDQALEQAALLLRLDPSAFWGHFVMGVAFREKGEFDKAIEALRRALEASGMPGVIGWLGMTLALSGNSAEARAWLERLHARAAHGHVPPTGFAWIHLGLGELDQAFEWLDRSVDECDQLMMPVKSYSFFDPLRADPRFRDLLRKMNLEP